MPQDTLELLRRADAAFALPKLGGMARPNGVVVVSERYWAFATTDGRTLEGRMPRPPEWGNRLPLARGLVRLFASLSPLFRRDGIARPRERLVLLAAVLGPFAFVLLPGQWATAAGIAVTIALLGLLLRGRALNLHGAE